MKYARVINLFSEITGITLDQALEFFYGPQEYQLILQEYHERGGYIICRLKQIHFKCTEKFISTVEGYLKMRLK